jgi:hypothetical protein
MRAIRLAHTPDIARVVQGFGAAGIMSVNVRPSGDRGGGRLASPVRFGLGATRLRPMLAAFGLHLPAIESGTAEGAMDSEQTTDQTFRTTSTPEGRIGVTVFVDGKPGVVLWLGSEDASAAERLALHLETQVDRVSSPAIARKELASGAM